MRIISRPGAEGQIVTDATALRAENEKLKEALDRARIVDQCIVSEAVAASTKALRKENDRLRTALEVAAHNLDSVGAHYYANWVRAKLKEETT